MKNDTLTSTVSTIASEFLAARLRLLNRTGTRIVDEALRPLGVKVGRLNGLLVVTQRRSSSPGAAARRLNTEKSPLSRSVDCTLSRDLLKVSDGDSGRKQILELGAPGRKLIEKSLRSWKKGRTRTEAMLGQRGARSIHRAANTVRAQLGQT